jgi:hypothetical protein
MEINEIWAYRKTGKHPLEPVRFLKHRRGTTARNKAAQVRFEDPEADGREEWVPTGRLKCSWEDAEAFVAKERRWAKVRAASRTGESLLYAMDIVLELMPDENTATTGTPGPVDGVVEFQNPATLAVATGLSEAVLCGAPESFEQDGVWVVPLATGLAIAQRLAAMNPDIVLMGVERQERELQDEQREWEIRNPYSTRGRQSQDWYEARILSLKIRREWVGEESNRLRHEAVAAQEEVNRLRRALEWAIKKLDGYGHKSSSATLQRYLDGAPVPKTSPPFMP